METCDDCKKEFRTERGLLTHRGMSHKVGVGGKPAARKRSPLPAPDLRQIVESGKVREVAEVAGKAYGQVATGFMQGMEEAMRQAKRAKKGSPEKVRNRG